ncbi:glutathione S-transferase family protein [Sphingobium sp. Sx8-8]|uniref:glutathione S-transferase family protein n=1 Tax=Sphingobium sp. Sx8-8 TaxID=2933617 RepID=UPI001F5A831B|nr:glutathione S-transferase family protein [Sphingobium sp. Sx8-8]
MTIVVHHLQYSRSTRLLWLLEELEQPYELVLYERDPSFRAPEALKQVHPLGRSPIIEIDGEVIAESGAIMEVLAERLGGGRLGRRSTDADWAEYCEWLHFAEGTAMTGLTMMMLTTASPNPMVSGYGQELATTAMALIDARITGRDYLLASGFGAADIHMSFVALWANEFGLLSGHPQVAAWLDRITARPAYLAALDKGGPWRVPLELLPAQK